MTDPTDTTFVPGPVPRSLRYLSWAVLVACIAMTFVGGWRNGVTEDEPYHVQRFDNYVQTGWYLADGQLDHGRPAAGMTQQYVYGPATMLVLHAVNAVVGVEPWGHAGTSSHAYAVRHVSVGVFGLLGLLAVVLTGRVLFRRWDWGFVAGATVAAVPLWTGHAMFNVKDVPVGTGYAWATLGLVLLARKRETARWWLRWGGPLALVVGSVLAVGTRPAMWSGIAFGALVLMGCRLIRREPAPLTQRIRADLWVLRDLVLGAGVSLLVLWWMEPKVFGSPITLLYKSVHSSAEFQDITAPWAAVPVWVAMQIPVLIICFALVGTVVVFRRSRRAGLRLRVAEARWLVVGAQAFVMPLGVMVTQSPVYGDLRQLLFSVPATALLATLGMVRLTVGMNSVTDPRVVTVAKVVAAASLAVPVAMQAMLFPYNYTFYNPLAAVARLSTNGDYYRASARELASDVPRSGRLVCSPEGDDADRATREAHLNGWMDCRTDITSPVAPYRDRFDGSGSRLAPDEFWALTFQSNTKIPPNCRRVTNLSRHTLWQKLQMATLSRCRLPFPTLPAGTTEFRERNQLAVLLPNVGWLLPSMDQSGYGVRTHGTVSTMVFRLPGAMRGRQAVLTFRTTDPVHPALTYGDVALRDNPLQTGTGFTVVIPRELVDRAITTAQTLEFKSGTSDPLVMKLLSIQLSGN